MLVYPPMKTDTRKSISIKLPVEIWQRAKARAATEGIPLWEWIASVLEDALARGK